MLILLVLLTLFPWLGIVFVVRQFFRDVQEWSRKQALRDVADRLSREAELAAAEAAAEAAAKAAAEASTRPVQPEVELEPSLIAMMKRDGFL